MNCPRCSSDRCYAIDSRPGKKGRRRRYECSACGLRWSTVEVMLLEYTALQDELAERREKMKTIKDLITTF